TDLGFSIQYSDGEPDGWLFGGMEVDHTPTELMLAPVVSGVPPGTYQAVVTVTGAEVDPVDLTVTFQVHEADEPEPDPDRLSLEIGSAEFEAEEGGADPDPEVVMVTSTTNDPVTGLDVSVDYGAGEAEGWLDAELEGSVTPAELELSPAIQGLSAGEYTATVVVTGDDVASRSVDILLVIASAGEGLSLDAESVEFVAQAGGDSPDPATVGVTSLSDTEVTGLDLQIDHVSGNGGDWLSATLDGGDTPAALHLAADTEELAPGEYLAQVVVSGTDADPATVVVSLVVTDPDLVGLRVELGTDLLSGDDVLSLDLQDLLSEPLLQVTVHALFGDGSMEDVTEATVLTTSDPLLTVDGSGVLDLATVLTHALTSPDHYLHARYQGFEVEVGLEIVVPILSELPLVDLVVEETLGTLEVGTALPPVTGLLEDGTGGTVELMIPAAHPELDWAITGVPVTGALGPIVNPLITALGNLVGDVITVTDGVITSINLSLLDGVLGLLGGTLTVDVSAILGDLVADPIESTIAG
ncbi:MAG: hypothetical protein EA352_01735, partial [Gemmatimonadales bacterium]